MSEMNIYQALLQAQQAFGPVLKTSVNPAFKTKYADLGSVIDAITPALHGNGLVVVQRLAPTESGPVLITELVLAASGEKVESAVAVVCKDPLDPQKVGAAVTYMRRYSLMALLGLAPEDDDGNAAAQPSRVQSTGQVAPAQPRATSPVAAATATVPPYPATKIATWTDDQLWAYACDESGQEAKRKATFSQYLSRLATDVDILFASEQMKALHPEDVAELRDKALAALRQPAGVAG